jgi:hypothetical protein
MGYTDSDYAADMHDQEMAEQTQALFTAEDTYRKFYETFGVKVAEASDFDRFDYVTWLAKHLEEAEALNKSASRVTICLALAGMPNYEVNDDRDEPKGLPTGIEMLEAIMPPATDETWGSYGRPTSFFHQVVRMGGTVKSGKAKGKPMHLIEILYHPRVGNQPGQLVRGYKLDSTGMVYAHLHGKGRITKDDLFEYWGHVERHAEVPEATNPAYLALIGVGPEVDDSPNRWSTPGASIWGCLDSLERFDDTVPERYKDISANRLSKALTAVWSKDAIECLKFLKKDDQRLLFDDVMIHAKVGESKYARSAIHRDLDAARTYDAKIKVLVTLYGVDNEAANPEAAVTVISELICRCAWAVIERVMDYRVGRSTDQVVDAATELMTHARTLEQLEALQQMVGDVAARIGATASGYEGEFEITTAPDEEPF